VNFLDADLWVKAEEGDQMCIINVSFAFDYERLTPFFYMSGLNMNVLTLRFFMASTCMYLIPRDFSYVHFVSQSYSKPWSFLKMLFEND
jgi:hypothetical protein